MRCSRQSVPTLSFGLAVVGVGAANSALVVEDKPTNLEYGLPRTEFICEKGHDRLDKYRLVKKDVSETGGRSANVRCGHAFAMDIGCVGIEYPRKRDDARFSGGDTDVEAHSLSIVFEAHF